MEPNEESERSTEKEFVFSAVELRHILSSDVYEEDFKITEETWNSLKKGEIEDLTHDNGLMHCRIDLVSGERVTVKWKLNAFDPEKVNWNSGILDLRSTYFSQELTSELRGKMISSVARKILFGYSFFECTEFEEMIIPASDFRASVFKDVSFKSTRFGGIVHMDRARFEGHTVFNQSTFQDDVTFSKARFRNTSNFTDTVFGSVTVFDGTVFEEDTTFEGAKFSGIVYYKGSQFKGETKFKVTEFMSNSEFDGAVFEGNTIFDSAKFSGRAIFNGKVQFKGETDFTGAEFISYAEFGGTVFEGNTIFEGVRFSGRAIFDERVEFKGVANFDVAEFMSNAEFDNTVFGGDATFGGAKFSGRAIFNGGVQFKGVANFDVAEFMSNAEFYGTVFEKNANFEVTKFSGRAMFYEKVQFKESTSFKSAEFVSDAEFDGTVFKGNVTFNSATLMGSVFFSKKVQFGGEADFGATEFASYTNFEGTVFEKKATFENVRFSGRTLFDEGVQFREGATFTSTGFRSSAEFENVVFKGDTTFEGAMFAGSTFFVDKIRFEKKVDFRAAMFKEYVRFSDVTFFEDATFERAIFEGTAIFGCRDEHTDDGFAIFRKDANFTKAILTNTRFHDVSFKHASFKETIFTKKAHFQNVEFYDHIKFVQTKFEKHLYFRACENGYDSVMFEEVWFGGRAEIFGKIKFLSLRGSVVEGTLNLNRPSGSERTNQQEGAEINEKEGAMDSEISSEQYCKGELEGTPGIEEVTSMALDIYKVNVLGTILINWKEHDVERSIYDGNIAYHKLEKKEKNQDLTETPSGHRFPVEGCYSHEEVAYQFQVLKEIYDRLGLYEYEDEAMVKYSRARNRQRREELTPRKGKEPDRKNRMGNRVGNFFSWLGIIASDVIGRLGTSPLRVATWMFFMPFLFGFIFIAFPGVAGLPPGEFSWSAFMGESRTSWVSFLTMSLGINTDAIPTRQHMWLIAEGIIGLFLMAYFTIAVARRTIR